MTTETVEREPALYITDAELIRRMGVPEKTARAELRQRGQMRAHRTSRALSIACTHSGVAAPVIDPANRGRKRRRAATCIHARLGERMT
jgi:hypothetical protein